MRSSILSTLLISSLVFVGCSGSEDSPGTTDQDTGASVETGDNDTGTASETGGDDTGTAEETGGEETGGETGGEETGGDTGGDTASAAPTFTKVYNDIIDGKCKGCHSGGGAAGNLNLNNKANAHANLVGKAAAGSACSGKGTRVVAGNAAMSILYQKVTTPTCGNKMPAGGAPALPTAQTDMIRDWINAGALNN